ncbi:hypothetical protein ACIO3O_05535 [Streptomyces sp. NPDC087440]|uniref:hypothetical protein n=1 Tax=Streptomyces sp. NPDC087440 TaxID=3365790 RepID=UPI00381B5AB4
MNRTTRTALCTAAVTGLVFGLGACSEVKEAAKSAASEGSEKAVDQVDKSINETYEVTYEVTGKDIESIEFHAGGGTAMQPKLESAKKPASPWTKTVTLKGIMPAAVNPISVTGVADLKCKVTYQGKVIAEAAGEKAMAGGCVAASPIAK